jgi:hypothetical protein
MLMAGFLREKSCCHYEYPDFSDQQLSRNLSRTTGGVCMLKNVLLVVIGVLLVEPAWALRCGRSLVVEGDYKVQVLRRCGEPEYKESRVEYRAVRLRGSGIQYPGLDTSQVVPVTIEEWTYDFGPNRFVEVITFEAGRVINIRALDYGD